MPQKLTPPHVATFPKGATVTATFATSLGEFVCTLHSDACPMTVGNCVGLARGETPWTNPAGETVNTPLYDGTVFHRVIPQFMIQGGDPTGTGRGDAGYRFADEIGPGNIPHRHRKGALSMANSGPNTNGSQFFITHAPQPHLDGKHTVFGQVSSGQEVVDATRQGDVLQSVTIQES